jgi:hypothetical protein
MPTPAEIINMVASLQNDTAQQQYTEDAVLPYLNMAMRELQEIFEENNIPVTNQVSSILTVPAGTVIIGFTTVPALPANLIEIQQVWESNDDGNTWIPMVRKEFIPHNLEEIEISSFGMFAWINNEIRVPPATGIIQLKLDYIQSIFNLPIEIDDVDVELGIRFMNLTTYLGYATGALCSMFIGENETRAEAQNGKAKIALERALNIPTKGRQAISTRRRPFRANYKTRGWF